MKENLIFSLCILISWNIWLKFKSPPQILMYLLLWSPHRFLVALKRGFACKNEVPHLTAIILIKYTKKLLKNPPAINWSDIILSVCYFSWALED